MKKTLIFATAAMAMVSAFADFSFAYLDTEGAKGEMIANDTAYRAYICMAEAAGTYFEGNTGYADIAAYLADNYAIGMGRMEAGGTAMLLEGFELEEVNDGTLGVYSFYAPYKPNELTDGSYIAIVAYTDDAGDMFHVFESEASGGKMAFMSDELGGKSSGWQAIPEPTSGLLLLLGVAGLALKRKRA